MGATAATAAYVLLVMRPQTALASAYGAVAVIAALLLTRRIVHRAALEFLPE